jgi:Aminopeptidase N
LPIPVKLALFSREGRMLPLHMDGQTAAPLTEQVVELTRAEQSFVFTDIASPPVPSLLRGFSAPVILECDYAPAELALLLAHDVDGFNRWEAGQQLALRAYADLRDGGPGEARRAWCEALASLFGDSSVEDALLADLLTPPGEIELAEHEAAIDPQRIHSLRQELQHELAGRIGAMALGQRYRQLAAHTNDAIDADSQARRRLKHRVLELLLLVDGESAQDLAQLQYRDAPGMTDRLAASLCCCAARNRRLQRCRISAAATPTTRWRWTSGLRCRHRCRARWRWIA